MKLGFDPTLEKDVEKIFASMGLSPKEAIKLFYEQVKEQNKLPFDIEKIPNEETQKALQELRAGKNVVRHKNLKEFQTYLNTEESLKEPRAGKGIRYETLDEYKKSVEKYLKEES